MAQLLDGVAAAAALRAKVSRGVATLARKGVVPQIVMMRVGDDPASKVYVRAKEKAAQEVGVLSRTILLPADISAARLRSEITNLNADEEVHGILLQLPLPAPLPEEEMLAAIDPAKDVDGFHPMNVGRLVLGLPGFVPATPLGVLRLMEHYDISVAGRRVVVIGRSRIVGRPLANMLSAKDPHGDATVTVCHSRTKDLGGVTREAEILIAAAGQKHLVTADMVSPGVVVIDVGIHREPDPARPGKQRLTGDVDFEAVKDIAAAITPVPGGVGPMTVAALMENTFRAACQQTGHDPDGI